MEVGGGWGGARRGGEEEERAGDEGGYQGEAIDYVEGEGGGEGA